MKVKAPLGVIGKQNRNFKKRTTKKHLGLINPGATNIINALILGMYVIKLTVA
jgi:hypothetical protein